MGLSETDLVNPQRISDTLRCPICMDVFEDPVFNPSGACQHVYCYACAVQALESDPDHKCPQCRSPLGMDVLWPHQGVRNMIDELIVWYKASCGWRGRLDARPGHAEVCPIVRLAVSEERCERSQAQIQELTMQLADREAKLAEHDTQLMERNVQIAELKSSTDHLEKRNRLQDIQLAECRMQIKELKESIELEKQEKLTAKSNSQPTQGDTQLEQACRGSQATDGTPSNILVVGEGATSLQRESGLTAGIEQADIGKLPHPINAAAGVAQVVVETLAAPKRAFPRFTFRFRNARFQNCYARPRNARFGL